MVDIGIKRTSHMSKKTYKTAVGYDTVNHVCLLDV